MQELCGLTKHLQATQRNSLLLRLVGLGLFQVISTIMRIGSPEVKLRATGEAPLSMLLALLMEGRWDPEHCLTCLQLGKPHPHSPATQLIHPTTLCIVPTADILLADVQHDPSQLRSYLLTEEGGALFGLLIQVRRISGLCLLPWNRAVSCVTCVSASARNVRCIPQHKS